MGFGRMLKGLAQEAMPDIASMTSMGQGSASEEEYCERAAEVCPADVYMISGCQDKQTSADVSNVSSFGLPADAGPGGAGGACTNALLSQAYKSGERSWIQLLTDMRDFLKRKGYKQVPQLSTSRKLDLNKPFHVGGTGGGRKLAVLVGINYKGQRGELSGCVNDVVSMKRYLLDNGYSEDPSNMQILVDVPHHDIRIPTNSPTKANIERAIEWLVSQARPGDSLFFHYSGHGGQQRDDSGDEEDGMDETLIPLDYQRAGVITDDQLFDKLVAPLQRGVTFACLMDCCHSGTILDLPFTFVANDHSLGQVAAGHPPTTFANPAFQAILKKILKYAAEKYPAVGKLAKVIGL
eukprot:TRINITY_DN238_c0_g3_i2.p1 TRINITY_DN238_c0_g3~~TRINITY_DN238_c0_g3_i2.p1  ORF type:complete len:373 (+),score=153.87 TRINITY_DN238_c0_g3_i2:68-1120(+)